MSYTAVKSLLKRGVSRPTLFQVILPVPGQTNQQLEFLCKNAAVPEVTANTISVNGHESLGVVREQATTIMYQNPFSITVISDRDYIVYKEIKRWFNSLAQNANPNLFGGNTGSSQRIQYYDSVKRSITLVKLEQNTSFSGTPGLSEPFRVQFNNAFPVRMGEITLDSSMENSYVEFSIDFAYETYTFVEGGFGASFGGIGGGTNLINTAINTIGSAIGF